MRKYAKIINDETKLCEVGLGTNSVFYQSIGMAEMEVELAYDGNWYLLGYAAQMPLDKAKEIKLDELQRLKNSKLSEFSYADKIFQIDTESKLNISGKVSEIMLKTQLGQEIGSINWIAKDNTIKTFSKEEFLTFAIAVATHTEMTLFKHDQLRTAVNSASSIDEVKAVAWVD